MNLQFAFLSRLLNQTIYLLYSGYLAFSLSLLILIFKGNLTPQLWFYLSVIALLLIAHHYVSIRVKFDADLLHFLSQYTASNTKSLDEIRKELDESLVQLQLLPTNKTGRPWDIRFQGCKKLFNIQILLLITQYIMLVLLVCIVLKNNLGT